MSKMDSKIIEEYQRVLESDPNSRVFAVLADAYREMGMLLEAENVARNGVTRHPSYAPGLVSLGRILAQKNDLKNAITVLQRAVQYSPDNLLAHQILGESFLKMKKPLDALKAHKMALFINPNNKRSIDVVKKLEALTADEFGPDVFAMQPLKQTPVASLPVVETTAQGSVNADSRQLERSISVVDALMVRQEHLLARERLQKLSEQFPGNFEIKSRWEMLEIQDELEVATPLKPLPHREKLVINQKVIKLDNILKMIESRRQETGQDATVLMRPES